MSNVPSPPSYDNTASAFSTFCDEQAALFSGGAKSLIDAVDTCYHHAVGFGIVAELGQDAVQTIMAQAFTRVRGAAS